VGWFFVRAIREGSILTSLHNLEKVFSPHLHTVFLQYGFVFIFPLFIIALVIFGI
jgi:hypothetical protein